MVLKFILLIFVSIYSTATCQSISCRYGYSDCGCYACFMTIDNPDGYDGFVSIGGTHDIYKSDIDVETVIVESGVTTIIPQIFCNQFPNLGSIYIQHNQLKYVTDKSFANCPKLSRLDAYDNPIEELHQNSFKSNPRLDMFYVAGTELTTLSEALFENNPNLQWFYFFYNDKVNSLPEGILNNNPLLEALFLSSNNLDAWNAAWSQSSYLLFVSMADNNIKEIPANAFNSSVLTTLWLEHNELSILESASFGDLSSLDFLDITSNHIHSIDIRIFNRARNLDRLDALDNVCIDKNYDNFAVNREANMEELRGCFEAFGIVNRGEKFLRINF